MLGLKIVVLKIASAGEPIKFLIFRIKCPMHFSMLHCI